MDYLLKQEKMSPCLTSMQDIPPMEDVNSDMSDDDEQGVFEIKKRKLDGSGIVLPPGFLDPLPQPMNVVPPPLQPSNTPLFVAPLSQAPMSVPTPTPAPVNVLAQDPTPPPRKPQVNSCKQFWKAGDYEVPSTFSSNTGGLDHARVHPKFLHSNATSHKWVLGAFAELLDNSVDEISNGATYVKVDVLQNQKDGNKMLLVEDNGGGMNTDTVRHCMSLGYSVKSKIANTIGQYGNGFKTSTMRLGADVLVFSRCMGKNGKNPTQSIGMLSYSFLRSTGKDDIVVPVIDFEQINGHQWIPILRSSLQDWKMNLDSIIQWSPYTSEANLLQQFDEMEQKGTRVIVYNLWEDDNGKMELDFDTDPNDIQIRDANRDEAMIEMADKYPSTRHFVNYRHSLRSYASILYLHLPPKFQIILRGTRVDHHNIVDDMMKIKKTEYRPKVENQNAVADVTIGFVKDARSHIDIQGFNVYHKNRLIKPFWRVWNAAGSGGRGIIGVLEANFVEPAHDKQGFENTNVLQRLSTRLQELQKSYWKEKSHEIGYCAPPTRKRSHGESEPKNDPPVNVQPLSSKPFPSHGGFEVKSDSPATTQPPLEEMAEKRVEEENGGRNFQGSEKAKSVESQSAVERFRSLASNPVYQNIDHRRLPNLRTPPSCAPTNTATPPRPIAHPSSTPAPAAPTAPPSSTPAPAAPTAPPSSTPAPAAPAAPPAPAVPIYPPSTAPRATVYAPRSGVATVGAPRSAATIPVEKIKQLLVQLKFKEEQCRSLEAKLKEKEAELKKKEEKIDTIEKETDRIIEVFREERDRREDELKIKAERCRFLEAELKEKDEFIDMLEKEPDRIIEEHKAERDRRENETQTIIADLRKKVAALEYIKQD